MNILIPNFKSLILLIALIFNQTATALTTPNLAKLSPPVKALITKAAEERVAAWENLMTQHGGLGVLELKTIAGTSAAMFPKIDLRRYPMQTMPHASKYCYRYIDDAYRVDSYNDQASQPIVSELSRRVAFWLHQDKLPLPFIPPVLYYAHYGPVDAFGSIYLTANSGGALIACENTLPGWHHTTLARDCHKPTTTQTDWLVRRSLHALAAGDPIYETIATPVPRFYRGVMKSLEKEEAHDKDLSNWQKMLADPSSAVFKLELAKNKFRQANTVLRDLEAAADNPVLTTAAMELLLITAGRNAPHHGKNAELYGEVCTSSPEHRKLYLSPLERAAKLQELLAVQPRAQKDRR